MVSTVSIVSICITLCITLVLPILLYIGYGIKNKQKDIWIAGALGACGFVLLQIMIRLEILNGIAALPGFLEWVGSYYVLYCLILAFSAGLFEVVARYLVAKLLEKNKGLAKELTYKNGIAAGIGHGGIEAIALVGATYANNLLVAVLINTGLYDAFAELLISPNIAAFELGEEGEMLYEQFLFIKQQMIEIGWPVFLMAGYERILTMIGHIALTLIVFYFVSRKKDILGITICLICHTAIDFVPALLNGMSTEFLGNRITKDMYYVLVYAFLTIVAIGSIAIILHIKKNWKPQESSSLISE